MSTEHDDTARDTGSQQPAQATDESVQEYVEEVESDPAYSPDDEDLKREKGG